MKNLALLLWVLLPLSSFSQNIWVADNNPNAPIGSHIFSSLQNAINAASAGDIVQVQPSPYSYGNVSINKQLVLQGIGFNLTKDLPLQSTIGNVSLTNNADNTSDADGTLIRGLTLGTINIGLNTGPSYTLSNITIYNCRFSDIYSTNVGYSPIDGLEVNNCYQTGSYIRLYMPSNNVIIRNNLLLGSMEFYSNTAGTNNIVTNNIMYDGVLVYAEGTLTNILNNDFIGSSGGETAFNSYLRDCVVANNIFYGSTPSIAIAGSTSTNFQRNIFTNNLVYSTGDDTMPPTGGGIGNSGSGNIIVSPSFVNVQLLDTWSSAYDFSLQGGSAALLAGSDGSDIGITGGAFPWTVTNLTLETTAIPTIETLNTSTIINPGDDLPVHVISESH